jgi:hypothetical protein
MNCTHSLSEVWFSSVSSVISFSFELLTKLSCFALEMPWNKPAYCFGACLLFFFGSTFYLLELTVDLLLASLAPQEFWTGAGFLGGGFFFPCRFPKMASEESSLFSLRTL